ncbi:outer membrane lipoprotein carrier protein LolA [Chitinophagaceae bacterium 26-R-25]|nr:outer membrane lipoprotein carrier protein LolA [Chitinophagaceae bacterium 26-R-25]
MKKHMHKYFFLIAGFFISLAASAQYAGYKAVTDIASFKQQFAAAAQKTQSIKSDFIQEKNLSMLSEKITSKGKFYFKKENLVRMEYTSPFQYLMIMNGSTVYIKDGQKENKISTKSNKLFQQINKITVDCIQGTALDNKDFTMKVFESGQNYLVELTPTSKNLKEFFKNINMTIAKKDFSVSKIDMLEPSGDNTAISFINKEMNTNLPDALFTIK